MEPLTIAEPSPNHPRDAPVPDASDYAEIIAEIAAAGNQNCRDPAFLRELSVRHSSGEYAERQRAHARKRGASISSFP